MKVKDKMTRDVRVASPDDTIQRVARIMAECDAGALPVGQDDRLVGMVTDRDIALRGVAEGKGPETPVREVMTPDVCYIFEDESLRDAADNMGREQVRRLPVVDRDKRLVGIISLGDLAEDGEHPRRTGDVLTDVSHPGGAHSQTGSSTQH